MDETLAYLEDRYKEEQARFDHFENKCAKFFTAVSVVIAALTAFATSKGKLLFGMTNAIDVITMATFLAAALCIACSWGHALSALRIQECPTLPYRRETLQWMLNADEERRKQYIYDCHIDTLEKLKDVIDNKSKPLDFAYSEIVYAAWALSLLAITLLAKELLI